ncbi:MAG TPA: hypothetical protein ENI43_05860 [Firmicutes bacterium]|nr:hypothetical protein [Bacillota bacterium]
MEEKEKVIRELSELVVPILERMGFELYDLQFMKSKRRTIVRIVIDNTDGYVSIEDCASVSSRVGAMLDLKEVRGLEERYVLEVSSPGIERELRNISDCERFINSQVSFRTGDGESGVGRLLNIEGRNCIIDVSGNMRSINFDDFEVIRIKMDLEEELQRKG